MDLFPFFIESEEDLITYHCFTVKKRKYKVLSRSNISFDLNKLTNGSQTSTYFDCPPPTLEEYFNS